MIQNRLFQTAKTRLEKMEPRDLGLFGGFTKRAVLKDLQKAEEGDRVRAITVAEKLTTVGDMYSAYERKMAVLEILGPFLDEIIRTDFLRSSRNIPVERAINLLVGLNRIEAEIFIGNFSNRVAEKWANNAGRIVDSYDDVGNSEAIAWAAKARSHYTFVLVTPIANLLNEQISQAREGIAKANRILSETLQKNII